MRTNSEINQLVESFQEEIYDLLRCIEDEEDLEVVQEKYSSLKSGIKKDYHDYSLSKNQSNLTEYEKSYYLPLISDIHTKSFKVPTNSNAFQIMRCLHDAENYLICWENG